MAPISKKVCNTKNFLKKQTQSILMGIDLGIPDLFSNSFELKSFIEAGVTKSTIIEVNKTYLESAINYLKLASFNSTDDEKRIHLENMRFAKQNECLTNECLSIYGEPNELERYNRLNSLLGMRQRQQMVLKKQKQTRYQQNQQKQYDFFMEKIEMKPFLLY